MTSTPNNTAVRDRAAESNQSNLLTVSEVASRLRVHKSVLYEWLSRRVIAFHRVGRLIRLREADVAEFIQRNRVDSWPDPRHGSRP